MEFVVLQDIVKLLQLMCLLTHKFSLEKSKTKLQPLIPRMSSHYKRNKGFKYSV